VIRLSDRLASLLAPDGTDTAVNALRAYFTPRPVGRYSGAHFERLGGGGDRPHVADEFTAEDLVAVATLAVNISGDAAVEILATKQARLREILRRIPTDRALADLANEEIGSSWPVRGLYRQLNSITSIGETSAAKLLARKRPHLVPILDSVIIVELLGAAGMAMLVQAGGVVSLVPRPPEFFYVGGEIASPGQKSFHAGMTLTQAVLASGGVTAQAGPKIKVLRQGPDGRLVAAEYDLKQIEGGVVPDPALQPGDRIEVLRPSRK